MSENNWFDVKLVCDIIMNVFENPYWRHCMQYNDVNIIRRGATLLDTSSVLRNTYLLLSLTLLFSAATAYYAMATGAGYTSSLVTSLTAFGLLFILNLVRNSAW